MARTRPHPSDRKGIKKCINAITDAVSKMNSSKKALLRHRAFLAAVLADATIVESGPNEVGLYNLWHPSRAVVKDVHRALNAVETGVEELEEHLEQQIAESDSEEESDDDDDDVDEAGQGPSAQCEWHNSAGAVPASVSVEGVTGSQAVEVEAASGVISEGGVGVHEE